MRRFLKYFVWLLSIFSLVVYYFLGTSLGHASMGYLVEDYYTKKMGNKIEILSLNISHYPTIIAKMKINDKTELFLNGVADMEDMNLSYHLRGNTFTWDNYKISNPVDVKGKMKGAFSQLLISGKGRLFDGNISYEFIRKENRLEDLILNLEDCSSELLVEFLEYKEVLVGRVNLFMNFDYYTSYRRKGLATVSMKKVLMPKVSNELEFSIDAEIMFKDLLHEFFADVHSNIGKFRLANGHYNRAANILTADYGLHINELSYFEKLLKHRYHGELSTAGSLSYESEKLILNGDSTSYEGLLEYKYQNEYLDLSFNGVSLEKILRQLSFPPLLSSKVYGTASYDLNDEIILINTKLRKTRFRRTKMTDRIHNVAGIDILKDVYNDSIFTAGYQDNVLTSVLQIDNGINHLYLKDTRMNSKTNEITADFEVRIDGEEFVGEVYGTLDNPQVSLDMSKLIKYQINKKMETFFGMAMPMGKRHRKEKSKLRKIPDALDQQVKQKTRSFLEGFFE